MKPGDLVVMFGIGIKSGTIAMVTGVNRISQCFVTYDVILDGEHVEGIDQSFMVPLECSEDKNETR